jgi:hypothetical protein
MQVTKKEKSTIKNSDGGKKQFNRKSGLALSLNILVMVMCVVISCCDGLPYLFFFFVIYIYILVKLITQ